MHPIRVYPTPAADSYAAWMLSIGGSAHRPGGRPLRNHLLTVGPAGLRLLCRPESAGLPLLSGSHSCLVCSRVLERSLRTGRIVESDIPAVWREIQP